MPGQSTKPLEVKRPDNLDVNRWWQKRGENWTPKSTVLRPPPSLLLKASLTVEAESDVGCGWSVRGREVGRCKPLPQAGRSRRKKRVEGRREEAA